MRTLYEVPDDVRDEAARALYWRKKFGRGGTRVGVATAKALVRGSIDEAKVRHVARYFPRHAVDARAVGYREGEAGFPSAGRIAWGLWGGDAGRRWVQSILASIDGGPTRRG
jgi:hypothetical protein